MKKNYFAWQVQVEDYPHNDLLKRQLEFLLRFAVLAPSSHNSQPWRFEVLEDSISVFPEESRRLPQSDKNNRQLYISLGCAIQNIVVAASYYGFEYSVEYLLSNGCAAKINLKKIEDFKKDDHLIFSITKRVNNRNRYKKEIPASPFLQKIQSLENEDLRIDIIINPETISKVANVAVAAGMAAMDDVNFRRELSGYVKSNFTKSKFGMPGFGLGIPGPISVLVPFLLRWINMNKLSKKADFSLLTKHTPALVVISTKQDNALNWLKAGEAFEYVALLGEKENIQTAIWAAPIQIGEFYKDLQVVLNTDFRPQVFFRLGYAEKTTLHSPREPYYDQ